MALPPADVWRRRFDEWSGSVSRLLYPDVLAERFGSDRDRGSVDPTAASLTPILARLDGAESGETSNSSGESNADGCCANPVDAGECSHSHRRRRSVRE